MKNRKKLAKAAIILTMVLGTGAAILAPTFEAVASGCGFPCCTCSGTKVYCGGYVGGPCGVKKMSGD